MNWGELTICAVIAICWAFLLLVIATRGRPHIAFHWVKERLGYGED